MSRQPFGISPKTTDTAISTAISTGVNTGTTRMWLEPAWTPETAQIRCPLCDDGEIPSTLDDRLREPCPNCDGCGWFREIPATHRPPL